MGSPVSTCSSEVPCAAGLNPALGGGRGLSGATVAGSHSLIEELLRLPLPSDLHFMGLPLALIYVKGEFACSEGRRCGLAVLVMKGCWREVKSSSRRCRLGREGRKRGASCARVFSGKVPLPLGMGRSPAGLKAKNKHFQLLSLELS